MRRLLSAGPDLTNRFVTGRVIADGGGSFVRTALLNIGAKDGVKKGQAVIGEGGYVGRVASFAAGLGLGWWVSTRKSWLSLLNGSLLGAVLFYLITNSLSWWTDTFYAKTLAGWWQCMTVGHPEFAPTITFFYKTMFGDIMFTGLFAGVMETLAKRAEEPSLLDGEEEEETEGEDKPVEAEVKD